MARHSKMPSPFSLRESVNFRDAEVVYGLNLDRHWPVKVRRIPPQLLARLPDERVQKIAVRTVIMPADNRRKGYFTVVPLDGESITFYGELEGDTAITSGSSGNAAFDTHLLGCKKVAVVGAVADDIDGGQIIAGLDAMGIGYGLVKADQTSLTLRLQDDARKILLVRVKGNATFNPQVANLLATMWTRVVGLTSLRKEDLGFALHLFQVLQRGRSRPHLALIPSVELIGAGHARQELNALFNLATTVVMNRDEFALLMQSDRISSANLKELAKKKWLTSGSGTWVITMDEEGAAVIERGRLVHVEPHRTAVEEPAGAGDAFLAGLMGWYEQGRAPGGQRLVRAVDEACFIAADKVGKHGPWGMPSGQRLARFRDKKRGKRGMKV